VPEWIPTAHKKYFFAASWRNEPQFPLPRNFTDARKGYPLKFGRKAARLARPNCKKQLVIIPAVQRQLSQFDILWAFRSINLHPWKFAGDDTGAHPAGRTQPR
jgi:hypothetical protein